MSRPPQIEEFKYKNRTLIRSAARSWRPGRWMLGRGSVATVGPGVNGLFTSSVFVTVTTPAGEVLTIEAWGKQAAKAHTLAAQITADARP